MSSNEFPPPPPPRWLRPPKVGDVVKLPKHRIEVTGIVVDDTCETGWMDVLLSDGEVVKWPKIQLKVVK